MNFDKEQLSVLDRALFIASETLAADVVELEKKTATKHLARQAQVEITGMLKLLLVIRSYDPKGD